MNIRQFRASFRPLTHSLRRAAVRVLLVGAIMSALAACGDSRGKARVAVSREVERLNADLPAYMRRGYSLDSIAFDPHQGDVSYCYSLDTAYVSPESFLGRLDSGKEKILNSYLDPDPQLRKFLQAVVDGDCAIIYRYRFPDGEQSIRISPQEIKTQLQR